MYITTDFLKERYIDLQNDYTMTSAEVASLEKHLLEAKKELANINGALIEIDDLLRIAIKPNFCCNDIHFTGKI